MIKKLIIADIQRTPETSGRNVFWGWERVNLHVIAQNKMYKNITYVIKCIYKKQAK